LAKYTDCPKTGDRLDVCNLLYADVKRLHTVAKTEL